MFPEHKRTCAAITKLHVQTRVERELVVRQEIGSAMEYDHSTIILNVK
jgi:hypothetical protein